MRGFLITQNGYRVILILLQVVLGILTVITSPFGDSLVWFGLGTPVYRHAVPDLYDLDIIFSAQ